MLPKDTSIVTGHASKRRIVRLLPIHGVTSRFSHNQWVLIMSTNPSAPSDVLEVIKCGLNRNVIAANASGETCPVLIRGYLKAIHKSVKTIWGSMVRRQWI